MAVDNVEIEFGSVTYVPEVEETPETSTTQGNVTINNMGRPGAAEHFNVQFMLVCGQDGELQKTNIFHWTETVTGLSRKAPYSEVELQAFRQLVPNLRSVADLIEQQVSEIDEKKSEDSTEVS